MFTVSDKTICKRWQIQPVRRQGLCPSNKAAHKVNDQIT